MTIEYAGQMENTDINKVNTRCAIISHRENDKKDEELYNKLLDMLYKTREYKISGFDGCSYISVEDKEDYNDLKRWYKKAKRLLSGRIQIARIDNRLTEVIVKDKNYNEDSVEVMINDGQWKGVYAIVNKKDLVSMEDYLSEY